MDHYCFLPIEIWQEIISKSLFIDQIRLRLVCKNFCQLEIHDFYDIPSQYLKLLTNQILFAYPFIKYLNLAYNQKVTTLNHMTKLEKLDVSDKSAINDDGIKQLNLSELNASNNPKITTLNHMTKLQKLHADGDSGINNAGIRQLNLLELYAYDNQKITTVNHMTKLRKLDVGGKSGIKDAGINQLKDGLVIH